MIQKFSKQKSGRWAFKSEGHITEADIKFMNSRVFKSNNEMSSLMQERKSISKREKLAKRAEHSQSVNDSLIVQSAPINRMNKAEQARRNRKMMSELISSPVGYENHMPWINGDSINS